MRWKVPNNGDTRTRSFFAWFPVLAPRLEVEGRQEWRWLERVTVEEAYYSGVGKWLAPPPYLNPAAESDRKIDEIEKVLRPAPDPATLPQTPPPDFSGDVARACGPMPGPAYRRPKSTDTISSEPIR